MAPSLLTIEVLTFGFALWLGLYLLARNPAKVLLRYAGLGLVAYGLGLAAGLASSYAPNAEIAEVLASAHGLLVLLPALCWSGALLQLLPIDRRLAIAAVVLDTLWVIGSVVLLVEGWSTFTSAGAWIVAIQALIVAAFAELQFFGVWRVR